MSNIPRSEVPEELKWDLSDHYSSLEAVKEDIDQIIAQLSATTSWSMKANGAVGLAQKWSSLQRLEEQLYRATVYLYCLDAEDCSRTDTTAISAKLDLANSKMSSLQSSIDAELAQLPDVNLHDLMSFEMLLPFKSNIEAILLSKPHILKPEIAKTLALYGEAGSAASDILSSMQNLEMKFPSAKDSSGNEHEVSGQTVYSLLESSDHTLRFNARHSWMVGYFNYKVTLYNNFIANVRDECVDAKVHNYSSSLSASLDIGVSPDYIRNMVADIKHNQVERRRNDLEVIRDYVGLPMIHSFDVLANMGSQESEFSIDQSKEWVEYAINIAMPEKWRAISINYLHSRNIDYSNNEGRDTGAFCFGAISEGLSPKVSAPWTPGPECLFTLGHEVGHAIHFLMIQAQKYSNISDANPDTTTAEVASTYIESVMAELFKRSKVEGHQQIGSLQSVRHRLSTIDRQTMFAEFEMWVHDRIYDNNQPTLDECCSKYLQLKREYFQFDGLSVVEDWESTEWLMVPHFVDQPHYVWSYAASAMLSSMVAEKLVRAIDDNDIEQVQHIHNAIDFLFCASSAVSFDKLFIKFMEIVGGQHE